MKKLALTFSLVIALSLLSGCISGGGETTPPETTLAPTEAPTTTPAPTTEAPTTMPPTTTPVPTWSPVEEASIRLGEMLLFGTHSLIVDDYNMVKDVMIFYLDDVEYTMEGPYEIEGESYNILIKVYISAAGGGNIFRIEYSYLG